MQPLPRIEFEIGEAFPVDDLVAQWMTVVSLAWNDLILLNERLLADLQSDDSGEGSTPVYITLHDSRQLAVAIWEISKFLRESARNATIAQWLDRLDDDARRAHDELLDLTDDATEEGWFKRHLVIARDHTAHLPELGSKVLKKSMKRLAPMQGSIEVGDLVKDMRIDFADVLASELFFAATDLDDEEKVREELSRFIGDLTSAVTHLVPFIQGALATYLRDERPGTWEIVRPT